jgi:diguanylate cyclase (GGDEF)-like protein
MFPRGNVPGELALIFISGSRYCLLRATLSLIAHHPRHFVRWHQAPGGAFCWMGDAYYACVLNGGTMGELPSPIREQKSGSESAFSAVSTGNAAPFKRSWVRRAGPHNPPDSDPPPQSVPRFESFPRRFARWTRQGLGSCCSPEVRVALDQSILAVYWQVAGALCAALLVTSVASGSRLDVAAALLWCATTLAAFLMRKQSVLASLGAHLVSAFPAWAWYSSLSPVSTGHGVGSHAVLVSLALPATLLVAVWGIRGALAAVLAGLGSIGLLAAPSAVNAGVFSSIVLGIVLGGGCHHLLRRLGALELSARRLHWSDSLTGLANLRLLNERARNWNASRGGGATVLYIGLNRFNAINRDLGRTVGDELLPLVAQRLAQAAPASATVARLGGDEFVVFAPGLSGDVEPRRLAKTFLARLREAFLVRGHAVHVGARVGVAVGRGTDCDLEELIRHADAAMQRAKKRANSIDELSWHGARDLSHAILLDRELRNALEAGDLTVEFQPIRELRTGRVVGAEALARWRHDILGPVPPSDFIPVAEDGGFITAIDQFVCRSAVECVRRFAGAGWDGWVSVNLSAESLSNTELLRTARCALKELDVPANRLVVEVTESRAMMDPDATASVLMDLKRTGVGVAIDDFGKGYSSLAYLKVFPVDLLKIDRTFVDGIGVDVRDEQLIEAILELAQRRGIAVVAEGVESQQQVDWLARRGCHYVQGFHVGRSVDADDFASQWGRETRSA